MRLYAESSAILNWVLGQSRSEEIRTILDGAEIVLTSRLTLVECERALVRAAAVGEIQEARAAELRSQFMDIASQWVRFALSDRVLERARQPFPHEPIRTLDALHLATALEAKLAVGDLRLLTLDERVRRSALGMGFQIEPR